MCLDGVDKKVPTPLREQELKRVLSNLINNAVEALPNQEGRVEVGAKRTNRSLEIWVRDDGRGMSEMSLSLLLESSFTFGKVNGRGLGFSYAKKIIEKEGGEIKVVSKLKEGTNVRIIF